jgi:hypothetical protein
MMPLRQVVKPSQRLTAFAMLVLSLEAVTFVVRLDAAITPFVLVF